MPSHFERNFAKILSHILLLVVMTVLQKQITELIMIEIFLFIIPCLEDGMPVMDSIAQKVLHCQRTGMLLVSFELSPNPSKKRIEKAE